MLRTKVPNDIRKYKTKLAGPFTLKQLITVTGLIILDKNGATYDNRLISATLYAQWKKTGTGFIQRPFLDSDMFYKAISILGNNGTVYNKNSVDSRMAHIDTANNPGYFSLLK